MARSWTTPICEGNLIREGSLIKILVNIIIIPVVCSRCDTCICRWNIHILLYLVIILTVSEKFDAWYQQNLPSDDETRHLIDPNMSDDSSMNLSFEAFAAARIPVSHSSSTSAAAAGSGSHQTRGSPAAGRVERSSAAAAHCNSAFTSSMSRDSMSGGSVSNKKLGGGQSTVNTTSDLGNSYHSDSLSSDECNTHQNNLSQQATHSAKQVRFIPCCM